MKRCGVTYPAWWNFITAALEMLSAALIVLPETRIWGLALGAMVLIAAIATLTWRREYAHLPPGVALAALTGIELALVLVD
ncbi:MAG: DoxX family protein [Roseiarcus sp.]